MFDIGWKKYSLGSHYKSLSGCDIMIVYCTQIKYDVIILENMYEIPVHGK